MLTISNLIFASIIHVPNVNTTVAYSAGGGFPTPITLTVNATDIEFTYDDFMGILMIGAQYFHFKISNPFIKHLPSLILLALSAFIAYSSI